MQYKVYGRKYLDFVTTVEANDSLEAYEKAELLTTDKWSEVENDETIEVYEVETK